MSNCSCSQCNTALAISAPETPAVKENTMTTANITLVSTRGDLTRLCNNAHDLDHLTIEQIDIICDCINEAVSGIADAYKRIGNRMGDGEDLSVSENCDITEPLVQHVVGWFFRHHAPKTFDVRVAVTLKGYVTVKGIKAMSDDEASDIANSIVSDLDLSADFSSHLSHDDCEDIDTDSPECEDYEVDEVEEQ